MIVLSNVMRDLHQCSLPEVRLEYLVLFFIDVKL